MFQKSMKLKSWIFKELKQLKAIFHFQLNESLPPHPIPVPTPASAHPLGSISSPYNYSPYRCHIAKALRHGPPIRRTREKDENCVRSIIFGNKKEITKISSEFLKIELPCR